jgi:hypothetical protein
MKSLPSGLYDRVERKRRKRMPKELTAGTEDGIRRRRSSKRRRDKV